MKNHELRLTGKRKFPGNGDILGVSVGQSTVVSFESGRFDLDFVERLLGRKGRLTKATRSRLEMMRLRITALLKPNLVYTVQPVREITRDLVVLEGGFQFASRKMAAGVAEASHLVVFVATVGEEIDREIAGFMEQNRVADAYVADALGSGAVESVAARFHDLVAFELHDSDRAAGLRFSPGYCDWPVSEQRKLFSLLDTKPVGVSLEESSLMLPRKSISAVFGVYDRSKAPKNTNQNPCRRCAKQDCIARRRTRKQNTNQHGWTKKASLNEL